MKRIIQHNIVCELVIYVALICYKPLGINFISMVLAIQETIK